MTQMSLEGTEYDLEKHINKVNPAARSRLWSRKYAYFSFACF